MKRSRLLCSCCLRGSASMSVGDQVARRGPSEVALLLLLLHRGRSRRGRSRGPGARRSCVSSISWMIAGQRRRRRSRPRRSAGSSRACGSGPLRICGTSPGCERHALVVDHDQRAVALDHRPLRGEVERHDRDLLEVDVLPDVELGPVREREDADALARAACARCRGATARAAGSSGPSGAARSGTRRSRSLARDFSSSRRAPPKAASKPYWSSACFSALGLHDVGVQRRAVRRTG